MCRRHYAFGMSVRKCVRASGRASCQHDILRTNARNFTKLRVVGVVEATGELVRLWRSRGQGQGRYKVRCKNLGTPYLLNGLKDHNQIWVRNTVRYVDDILMSFTSCGPKVKVRPRSCVKIVTAITPERVEGFWQNSIHIFYILFYQLARF